MYSGISVEHILLPTSQVHYYELKSQLGYNVVLKRSTELPRTVARCLTAIDYSNPNTNVTRYERATGKGCSTTVTLNLKAADILEIRTVYDGLHVLRFFSHVTTFWGIVYLG